MAIVPGSDTEYRTAIYFKVRCFIGRKSLLFPELDLWTPDNLMAASHRLLARDDKAGSNYMDRMKAQLGDPPAPRELYQLIAESMVLYYLFPASTIIKLATKVDRVETVLSWAGITGMSQILSGCFAGGIGNVGTHYLSAQPYLMNFFLTFALEGQIAGIDFNDREACEHLADDIRSKTKHVVEARHVLLHLLFPEYYESIASDTHKNKIAEKYRDLAPGIANIDEALVSIRNGLTEKLGHEVEYYVPEFRKEWDFKDGAGVKASDTDTIPNYSALMLPYLQLIADGEQHKESDLLDPLAESFSLSAADRARRLESGAEKVFDNRVRWAKVNLRQARLVEIPAEGYIRITERGKELLLEEPSELTRAFLRRYPEYVDWLERERKPDNQTPPAGNVWIEKTITENRPDRLSGDYALGKALWSPQKDAAGRDAYRFMRDVRPGDIILHLTDSEGFTGVSTASGVAQEFMGVSGTQWGDQPCYFVTLTNFRKLDPPLLKATFFNPPYREQLSDIRKRERNLFYIEGIRLSGLRLPEGFYLTPAPPDLVNVLNGAYTDLTGRQLFDTPAGDPEPTNPIVFSFDDLLRTTLWAEPDLNELLDVFEANTTCKQVILTGPPGTGKTWVAMQVIKFLTNSDDARWRLVQFHPSYSYEQFVEGLRPTASDGAITFKPVPGLLLEMVERAKRSRDSHYLLMDEMNRANLPRVLGELLFLFEYRDVKVDLPYTRGFSLPDNLYFIGTMNTADRSIRSVDAALRRRVEIFECLPSRQILEKFYDSNTNQVVDLFDGFEALNTSLEQKLDRHHTVGHTFFMAPVFSPSMLRIAWKRKIKPLIEEYFFDRPDELLNFEVESFWPSLK